MHNLQYFPQKKVNIMLRNQEDAFTGLEAAIVLIAFVVVAAVFSYVVLGAGFFTTQKAQETIYKGVEQSTTNILIKGAVYGLGTPNGPITSVNMTLAVAPGAPSIDLTNMKVIYSNATIQPVTMSYTAGVPVVNVSFHATSPSIAGDSQVTIWIPIPVGAPPNTEMNFELRPAGGGAPIPITKQVPPYTTSVNILR
jgi:flagellin FlaB